MTKPLGRRVPTDWRHVERYPLTALRRIPINVPMVLGINWYSNFDNPVKIGNLYWIGRGSLGSIRGGHAICAKPPAVYDSTAWWEFYDQGWEGSCVGFAESRMMTLLNRKRYAARWLYGEAQLIDEWSGTPPEEGTSVRAGCDILRDKGHVYIRAGKQHPVSLLEGISVYRWATSWDEVREVLGVPPTANGVPLLNSWGRYYPHIVRITDEAGARVLDEYGEACVVTDR